MSNNKLCLWFSLMVLFMPLSANATWYVTTVEDITVRGAGTETYYIKTAANPNPANCPQTWAGASWRGTGSNASHALSVALTAKTTKQQIRLEVDSTTCDSNQFPLINWIQLQ